MSGTMTCTWVSAMESSAEQWNFHVNGASDTFPATRRMTSFNPDILSIEYAVDACWDATWVRRTSKVRARLISVRGLNTWHWRDTSWFGSMHDHVVVPSVMISWRPSSLQRHLRR